MSIEEAIIKTRDEMAKSPVIGPPLFAYISPHAYDVFSTVFTKQQMESMFNKTTRANER